MKNKKEGSFKKKGSLEKKFTSKEKDSFINFIKAKPGFVFVFVVFSLIILWTVFSSSTNFEDLTLSANYAKQASEMIRADINGLVESIDEEIALGFTQTIEDDYFYSFRDDLKWIENKEREIFNSSPNKDVLVKEMALTLAMEDIVYVNEQAGYDFYAIEYDSAIEQAKNLDYNYKSLAIDTVLELFAGEEEKFLIFENTYNEIMQSYFYYKMNYVNSDSSKERRFIEAKKAIYVYYT